MSMETVCIEGIATPVSRIGLGIDTAPVPQRGAA